MLVFKYLKSCCVDNWDIIIFICLDDEVIIFVGELGILKVLKDIIKFLFLLMVYVWCVLIMIVGCIVLFVIFVFKIFWYSNDSFYKWKVIGFCLYIMDEFVW